MMSEQTLWVRSDDYTRDDYEDGFVPASPSELLAAVAGLATEPDYEAAMAVLATIARDALKPTPIAVWYTRAVAIVDAALAGRIVLDGSET